MGWLALLILDMGAMRRPEDGDRHEGTNSHVFFISKPKMIINAELGRKRQPKNDYYGKTY